MSANSKNDSHNDLDHLTNPGNWLVHRDHGVGQVEGVETKQIGKHKNTYCRIETSNITLWVPIEKMTADWFRPVAAAGEIRQALKTLAAEPDELPDNINTRKSHIRQTKLHHDPADIASMIRDLWARRVEKKVLATNENQALQHFMDSFVAEWALAMDIPKDQARQKLEKILKST